MMLDSDVFTLIAIEHYSRYEMFIREALNLDLMRPILFLKKIQTPGWFKHCDRGQLELSVEK